MLGQPHRYYGLEPEKNIFVQSRVEYIIYKHLMDYRLKYSESHNFDFEYEKFPEVDGNTVRIRTDFTIYTRSGMYYWEHLGMLNKPSYKKTWLNYKRPTYEKYNLLEVLVTTDELTGINEEKIDKIITDILNGTLKEDGHKTYSNHHYSLR